MVLGTALGIAGEIEWAEYDFNSPEEQIRGTIVYARTMGLGDGLAYSWWFNLNNDQIGGADDLGGKSVTLRADAKEWQWYTGFARFSTKLNKGLNTVKVVSRQGGPGIESIMDVFVIATSKLDRGKADELFKNEPYPKAFSPSNL